MIEEQSVREWIAASRILQSWHIEGTLGRGKRSVVFGIARGEGKDRETSALKVIRAVPDADEIRRLKDIGLTDEAIAEKYRKRLEKCRDEVYIMQQLQGEAYLLNYLDFEEICPEGLPGGLLLIREEKLTPLKERLSRSGVDGHTVAEIALCVAKALEVCHRHRPDAIIHGDVKPDNIFWLRDDIYKLGDFGISSFESEPENSSFEGTPFYDAPEKSAGLKTPGTDIYALGKTLEVLLKNDLPGGFDGGYGALREIVRDMTEPDPSGRLSDISEVIRRLQGIRAETAVKWRYPNTDSLTETQTDWIEKQTRDASDEESIIPDLPERKPDAAAGETEQPVKTGKENEISGNLEDIHRRHLQKEREKKRRKWLIAGAVFGAAVLIAGIILISVLKKKESSVQQVQAILSMQEDPFDYGTVTCLVYSYPADCGFDGKDKHSALMHESLLLKAGNGTVLPVSAVRSGQSGLYLHLTASNGYENVYGYYQVALRTGDRLLTVTADQEHGKCGVFGKNVLYLDIGELFEGEEGQIASGQEYELSVYSPAGLMFRCYGKTT